MLGSVFLRNIFQYIIDSRIFVADFIVMLWILLHLRCIFVTDCFVHLFPFSFCFVCYSNDQKKCNLLIEDTLWVKGAGCQKLKLSLLHFDFTNFHFTSEKQLTCQCSDLNARSWFGLDCEGREWSSADKLHLMVMTGQNQVSF